MEEERTYTVYCHTNKTNGKKYVGITKQTLNQRWRQGKGYGKTSPIYKAIKHYGWDGFDHDVLEDGLTYEEACEAEKRYIRELNCLVPNGYNLEYGGNAKKECNEITRKKISDSHKGKSQIISEEERKRRSERMKRLCPMHDPVLKKKCMERRKQSGYKVSEEMKAVLSKKAKERLNTPEWKERLRIQNTGERNPVYGKAVSEQHKLAIRNAKLGKKMTEQACLNMSRNHADNSGGNNYNSRPVNQLTLDGNFVAQYDSISTAKKAIGVGDVSAVLQGKTKTAGGFRWEYANVQMENFDDGNWRKNIRPKGERNIKIVQFDLNGNKVAEYTRLQDAAEAMEVGKSSISRCCLGKTETIKGFVFQYR